tara:strand:+ start:170 stop:466 length:297 start_codon:yes stop_codon:yes gene_type:complete
MYIQACLVEVQVIDLALLQFVEGLEEKQAVEVLVPNQTEVVLEAVGSFLEHQAEMALSVLAVATGDQVFQFLVVEDQEALKALVSTETTAALHLEVEQ